MRPKQKLAPVSLILSALFVIFLFIPLVSSASIVPCATTENSAACTLCHLIVGFSNLINTVRKFAG